MHLPPEFRDVGASVNQIMKEPVLRENVLFRSGELALTRNPASIGAPKTIVNLEITEDPDWASESTLIHLPFPNTSDVYDLSSTGTRDWIESVLRSLAAPETRSPVLVHCTAGKDRTGVTVAATLAALGVPQEVILAEYSLSEGPLYTELLGAMLDVMTRNDFVSPQIAQQLRRNYKEPEHDEDGKASPAIS